MSRNMSFAFTTQQVRDRTKTVTRRFGWWFLKPGDTLNACKKCMGLKKGEKVKKICKIRVVSTRKEPLDAITKEDCVKEGFPHYEPNDFVNMMVSNYRCAVDKPVNRIEFKYID